MRVLRNGGEIQIGDHRAHRAGGAPRRAAGPVGGADRAWRTLCRGGDRAWIVHAQGLVAASDAQHLCAADRARQIQDPPWRGNQSSLI